ncbi:MAG: S-adenosylmethionine--diacylglycerol 3-amino-3-carboxypropyl transferase [Hyphomicrobiales bacterium]|nr:S-adenosylmethionine--diacylglycerol 3-amino-3-carboxypropyl transferase [Hyphomicrobiales bacterium]
MSDIAVGPKQTTAINLEKAVHRHSALSSNGIFERLFTRAFRDLVYPQIWEDPVVDMTALEIGPRDHIVAIASGGCNVLSYLTASPARITAIDLNHAHIALLHLKLAAAAHLPGHAEFSDFFKHARRASNIALFDEHIAPHLDASALRYWCGRDVRGRRRIEAFARGFYRTGLLGRFIGASHLFARLHRVDLGAVARAGSLEEQRRVFDEKLAPIFDGALLKQIVRVPAALFGLGIPPRQYEALASDGPDGILTVLRARLEKLACDFPVKDNYFAWQAFARGYDASEHGSVPPYLEAQHFEQVRKTAGCIEPLQGSVTEFLARSPAESADCYVLLDAQDWMSDADLTSLWYEIERTSRPGARIIFRTAADERLLPGRVPDTLLQSFVYEEERSRELHARDRSSIYGAFHLYRRRAA